MVYLRLCPDSARILDERLASPQTTTTHQEALAFVSERFQTACDIFHVLTIADRALCLEGLATTTTTAPTITSAADGCKTNNRSEGSVKNNKLQTNDDKKVNRPIRDTESADKKSLKKHGKKEKQGSSGKKGSDDDEPAAVVISTITVPSTFESLLAALEKILARRRLQLTAMDDAFRNPEVPLSRFHHDMRVVVPLSLVQSILALQPTAAGVSSSSGKGSNKKKTKLAERGTTAETESVTKGHSDELHGSLSITRVSELLQHLASQSTSNASSGTSVLVISPSVSPPNPSRRQKNIRLLAVEQYEQERQYNEMVKGVTPGAVLTTSRASLADSHQRGARRGPLHFSDALSAADAKKESYASFMKDVRFGLDMRLMSLAGSIVGYYLCHVRGYGLDVSLVGAAVGAIVMLFVDAVLLMIRIGKEDAMEQRKKKKRDEGRRLKLQ